MRERSARDGAAARRPGLLWAVMLLVALTAGCGGASDSTATPGGDRATPSATAIEPATLKPGQRVPVPAGKPVLTLTGAVSARNVGATVAFDLAALERIGLVRALLHDPWAKKDIEVRGVWLSDLLRVAGAAAAGTNVHLTALDDYQVDLTMADVHAGGILLAVGTGDGKPIEVEDGGPTRIVFLDDVRAGANADQWIWSLKTIEVR